MSYVILTLFAFLLGVAFERWLNRTEVYDEGHPIAQGFEYDDEDIPKPGGTI